MSRLITVSLDKRSVSCVARLLDDQAPRTCAAVWENLRIAEIGKPVGCVVAVGACVPRQVRPQ